jgi:hypothetical protein
MSRKKPDRKSSRRRAPTRDDQGDAMKGRHSSSQLDDRRLADVRDRIRDGSYNDPQIADAVARRILEFGDLRVDGPDPFYAPRRNPDSPIH